jgi:hypothetical protein
MTPSRSEAAIRYLACSRSAAFDGILEQATTAAPEQFGKNADHSESMAAGEHTSKRKWLCPKKVAK